MILIDYSGISIAPVAMGQAHYGDENLIRHMILNSIRMYRQKFKEYGEVVIVADGGGNWRKDLYPEYKGKRKANRDESKIDWDEAFRIINMVLQELKDNFPYKVIHQWGCEADDSIAEIVHWTQEFGNYEKVMIVSADKDFRQLQVFDNVYQYSPMTKKLMKEDNPRLYLAEHILTGDSGDGVPNVLSDDDTFLVEGKRQNVLSKKKKEQLLDDPKALGEQVYRNYMRNKTMIDLITPSCPDPVRREIINSFESQDEWQKKGKVFPYLVEKKCRLLVESVQEFID
jgi:hypothetical protein